MCKGPVSVSFPVTVIKCPEKSNSREKMDFVLALRQGLNYVALAGPELTIQTKLASDTEGWGTGPGWSYFLMVSLF